MGAGCFLAPAKDVCGSTVEPVGVTVLGQDPGMGLTRPSSSISCGCRDTPAHRRPPLPLEPGGGITL